jgi:hypothetical protein
VIAYAVRDDRTKIRLTWTAPATDFGGAITLYRIQHATDAAFTTVCTTCPTSTTTATVITLAAGTPYFIRVVAVRGKRCELVCVAVLIDGTLVSRFSFLA